MKNTFTAWTVIIGVCGFVPAVQAAEKCDAVVLLSVSQTQMPTREGWIKDREARFMRQVDNVTLQLRPKPHQLSESDIHRARYDHGPHFRLCSVQGEIDILPVPK